MKNTIQLITISFLISLSILVYADDDHDHDEAKRLLDSGDILALEIVLQKVREIQPGKILEVELETKHSKKVYEIELLTPDSRVLELLFDARTGEHLSTEKED